MTTVEEFIQLHGGHPVYDGDGCLLLPDGAMIRNAGTARLSSLYDPPADPRQRLRRRLSYARKRHSDVVNAEQLFHASCCGSAATGFRWDATTLGPAPAEWDRLASSAGKDFDAEQAVKDYLKALKAERFAALGAVNRELANVPVYQPL